MKIRKCIVIGKKKQIKIILKIKKFKNYKNKYKIKKMIWKSKIYKLSFF